MHYSTLIVSAIAALPFTSAVGTATVRNYCAKPLCVYQTAPGGGPITATYTLQGNGTGNFQKSFAYPSNGMVGSQLRVSPTCDPNNIVYWEYAQGNNIIVSGTSTGL